MKPTTVEALVERYDALLIDAYGVLIDQSGALAGAANLVEMLDRDGVSYAIVTNDASKLETTSAAHLAERGLRVAPERIVTSGGLLGPYFAANQLEGATTMVLGPEDSVTYVRRAGGEPVGADAEDADVVVLADEAGFDFLPGIEAALSVVLRRMDRGAPVRVVLPNPDLIYPQAEGHFGLAAGSMALFVERAVHLRFGEPLVVDRLGKPFAPIFDAATTRVGTKNAVMIGDQLHTDVAGARAYGLDAALATWGLTKTVPADIAEDRLPTWLLRELGS